jgi:hypothetical protein
LVCGKNKAATGWKTEQKSIEVKKNALSLTTPAFVSHPTQPPRFPAFDF